MLVSDIMTRSPLTVFADTSLTDAQMLMRREHVHRLPVVDHKGHVCGIVSEKDLLNVSPSKATTLDVYEIVGLLAKIKVDAAMTKEVKTVVETALIEDAARMLVDFDIGGLPVVDKSGLLVGIVTESDLFRLFIDMFGVRRRGIRMSFLLPEQPGELAAIGTGVAKAGGNIIAFSTKPGVDPTNTWCVMKIEGLDLATATECVKPFAVKILDVRES